MSKLIMKTLFVGLCLLAPAIWGLTIEAVFYKLRRKSASCKTSEEK